MGFMQFACSRVYVYVLAVMYHTKNQFDQSKAINQIMLFLFDTFPRKQSYYYLTTSNKFDEYWSFFVVLKFEC